MIRVWIFLTLSLICSGCLALEQAAESKPVDTKALLEQRVTQYWLARQSRDVRTLYDMESGSLPGKGLTPDKAMDLAGLRVKNVKTEVLSVESNRAKIRVNGDVLVGTLGWAPQILEEQWVLIDGQWYHETKL